MEAALEQIRQVAAEGEDAHQRVMVALRDMVSSLENPHDTIHRFGQMVRFFPVAVTHSS